MLLTNDDGYDAVGVRALKAAFDEMAKVAVVAPVENLSGVGSAQSIEGEEQSYSDGDQSRISR